MTDVIDLNGDLFIARSRAHVIPMKVIIFIILLILHDLHTQTQIRQGRFLYIDIGIIFVELIFAHQLYGMLKIDFQ